MPTGSPTCSGTRARWSRGSWTRSASTPTCATSLRCRRRSRSAMADGYARATRKPTLVQLHSGVGLGNGVGMMYQAKRGHAPLVVIAGESGVRYDAMDAQMASDLVGDRAAGDEVVDARRRPARLLRVLRRAIKIAATPPTGPGLRRSADGRARRTERRGGRADVHSGHACRARAQRPFATRRRMLAGRAAPDHLHRRRRRALGGAGRADAGSRSSSAPRCGARTARRSTSTPQHPLFRGPARPHVRRSQQGDHVGGRRGAHRRHLRLPGGVPGARGRLRNAAPRSCTSTSTPTRSRRTFRSTSGSSPTRRPRWGSSPRSSTGH